MNNYADITDDNGRLKPGYFLRLSDIERSHMQGKPGLVPYARATIYRLIESKKFPKPRKNGTRNIYWLSEDIQAVRDSLGANGGSHVG